MVGHGDQARVAVRDEDAGHGCVGDELAEDFTGQADALVEDARAGPVGVAAGGFHRAVLHLVPGPLVAADGVQAVRVRPDDRGRSLALVQELPPNDDHYRLRCAVAVAAVDDVDGVHAFAADPLCILLGVGRLPGGVHRAESESGDHIDAPSEDALFMLIDDLKRLGQHLRRHPAR